MSQTPASNENNEDLSHAPDYAYRAFFHNLPEAVAIANDTVLADVNQACLQLFRCKREDMVGKFVFQFVHPKDLAKIADRRQRWLDGAPMDQRFNFTALRPDGSSFEVEGLLVTMPVPEDGVWICVFQDVKEKQLDVEALMESERRLRSFIEHISDIVTVLDSEGIIRFESPSIERVLGYKHGEALGKSVFSFVHPDDLPLAIKAFEFAINNQPGMNPPVQIRCRHRDGSWRIHDVVGNTMVDDSGFRSIIINSRDITEYKHEEDLMEAVHRCRLDLGLDHQANIDRITAAAGETLGADCALYNRLEGDQLVTAGIWNEPPNYCRTDNSSGHICCDIHRIAADECIVVRNLQESPYYETDPNVRSYGLQTYAGHVVRAGGKPVGVLCVVFQRDRAFTSSEQHFLADLAGALGTEEERFTAEQALRESEKRYRGLIESQEDLIVRVDPEGRFTFVNEAYCRMFGRSSEELLGSCFKPLVYHEDIDATMAELEKLKVPPYRCTVEQRAYTRHGLRWLYWEDCAIRDETGEIVEIQAIGRDITERKQGEEALLRSLKDLERAYQLQSEFVRNMTHEVRTPLTGVIGCARALLEGVTGNVSDEQRLVLKRIVDQAQSLLSIVEEVLESATLAAGVRKLDLRALRVEQLVRNVYQVMEVSARERGLALNVQIPSHLPVVVTDVQKLTRILNNLISNAIKFTFEGAVTISVYKVEDGVNIVVMDTGIGIPPEKQEHVFDAFVQLSYPGKHKPVGAGLGLSIVSELVDALGCSLTLSSVPDLGTAFTLHVPLSHEQME